jgi:hypothetical protein
MSRRGDVIEPQLSVSLRRGYALKSQADAVIAPRRVAGRTSLTRKSGRRLFLLRLRLLLLRVLPRRGYRIRATPLHVSRLLECLGGQLRQFVGIMSVSVVACF